MCLPKRNGVISGAPLTTASNSAPDGFWHAMLIIGGMVLVMFVIKEVLQCLV